MAVFAADRLFQAQRILASLEERYAAAQDRQRELARRRREIAYAAEAGTEPFAAQTLASLRTESATVAVFLEDAPHAISGARAAIQAAEAAVVREQEKASATLPAIDRLRSAAAAADAAADALIARLRDVSDVATELSRSGLGMPRNELYRVAIDRGLQTTLSTIGLAPRVKRDERTTIVGAIGKLADQAESRLRRLAGEPVPEGLQDDPELVDAVSEPAATSLDEQAFAEVATAASAIFNYPITPEFVRETADDWLSTAEAPVDPIAVWILQRLKAREGSER